MAQIVAKVSELRSHETAGDILSIHEDDVELSGPGYASCEVIQVVGLTETEVRQAISDNTATIEEDDDGNLYWLDNG